MISSTISVRMDTTKKNRGNSILKRRGVTPSQCINRLYDLMIEKDDLLWDNSEKSVFSMSANEIDEAQKFISQIPRKSRFSTMTDSEIRQERLMNRGMMD